MNVLEGLIQTNPLFSDFYPPDVFEMRIKEEMVRSKAFGNSFAYIELTLNAGLEKVISLEDQKKMWLQIIEVVIQMLRGSDVKGALIKRYGFGVLLLDTHEHAMKRLENRIEAKLQEEELLHHLPHGIKDMMMGYLLPEDSKERLSSGDRS